MNRTRNQGLTGNARSLRREMTPEEKQLWFEYLRNLPCTVNRQKVIGNDIVDFYIASAKLVLELDGSQHYEAEGMLKDQERDLYLESLGLKVLRIPNPELRRNFYGVCETIRYVLDTRMEELRKKKDKGGAPQASP